MYKGDIGSAASAESTLYILKDLDPTEPSAVSYWSAFTLAPGDLAFVTLRWYDLLNKIMTFWVLMGYIQIAGPVRVKGYKSMHAFTVAPISGSSKWPNDKISMCDKYYSSTRI